VIFYRHDCYARLSVAVRTDNIGHAMNRKDSEMQPVNPVKALDAVTDHWSPKVVGKVNDQYIKVAKVKGELVWHKHDDEDELFQVIKGRLVIQLEGDRAVTLQAGEFFVVPKGVMHNPIAEEECWILLIETVTTKHTGDAQTPLTRTIDQQLV
jgi:quercetin dioxygenase-like cupin family protein